MSQIDNEVFYYTQAERKRIIEYREPSALSSNEILKLTAIAKNNLYNFAMLEDNLNSKGNLERSHRY